MITPNALFELLLQTLCHQIQMKAKQHLAVDLSVAAKYQEMVSDIARNVAQVVVLEMNDV